MVEQQVSNPESGLRDQRVEFVREDDIGVTPSDPEILKYSDTVTNVTWSADATNEPRRGLGNADPTDFIRGPESHEVTVEYDLVKWFTDGSGDANDAAYDGMARDADNLLPHTHTVLTREDKGSVASENSVSGNSSRPARIYTVARGAMVDEVAITGDPSDSQPVTVELSYVVQKTRSYQVDQPETNTEVVVASSSSNDTSQTVTVEGMDDSSSYATEDVALSGTGVESTTTLWESIDAVYLDDETEGDVTVSINDGTEASPTEGDELMVISGSETYDGIEGDLGVPGEGSNGSRESVSSLGDVETFLGDVIQRSASPVPHEIQSLTLTVSNNVETTERTEAFGMALFPANRNLTVDATMYGETTTHNLLVDHLESNAKDISWEMDGGTVTLSSAVLTDPGDRAAEEGQAVMTTDNTFTATGISFS